MQLGLLFPFTLLSSLLNQIQNLEAADAQERYPREYTTWREDPCNFCVNGVYPVRKLWGTAREAWNEILFSPVSSSSLSSLHHNDSWFCCWNLRWYMTNVCTAARERTSWSSLTNQCWGHWSAQLLVSALRGIFFSITLVLLRSSLVFFSTFQFLPCITGHLTRSI